MDRHTSLFEKWISGPSRPWAVMGGAVLLLLIPMVGAYLEGSLGDALANGRWRGLLASPVVIIYILVIAPRLERMGDSVLRSLRPLVPGGGESFDRLVQGAETVSSRSEMLAFSAGALVGALSIVRGIEGEITWLTLYWLLATCLMYGLLAWTIYVSIAGTRVTAAILRQPLAVDPLDITPFEAIGRQSLLLALVFIGGITLSLLFSAPEPGVLRQMGFWLTYVPIVLVPVLIFFLNMQPTHRLLAKARGEQLQTVQAHIRRVRDSLLERLDGNEDVGTVAQEMNALAAIEQRLLAAQTWPYDTPMLRTLFVSVLIPAGTMVVRLLLERITG